MQVKILALREKRAQAWDAAKKFLENKQSTDGMLSAEDAATYDKMETDIVAMGKDIERMERQAAMDSELSRPTSEPITNAPSTAGAERTGRASNEYNEDFMNVMRGNTPAHNVLSTTPNSDGGYLVPTEFERRIVQGLEEENVIRKIARVITTGAEREIPVAASGSTATWTGENAKIPESGMKFDQKTLDAFKLTNRIKVSIELMQDSMFDLAAYIAEDFARAFGAAEEEAFCIGTGVGRPTGLFTAKGADVGLTAAANGTIKADELIDLVYSLKSPYRRKAVFLMNDKTVAVVRKMKDANGQYLWQPSVQGGEPDKLLGYGLHTSPFVPLVKAGGLPIAFGDFTNYWIADRMRRTMQRLNELYAENGQVGFIGTQRVDGKVILPEGIKLLEMAA
ncbi:MAG: phage major capsid protein [Defluviitaleaceae bacterium]|nr:phage major capsid protein [Defluviitaleaceae bacterium]